MNRSHVKAVLVFILIAIAFAFLFSACSKRSSRHSTGNLGSISTSVSQEQSDGSKPQPVERTLAQVIAEIEAYEPPDDAEVDPDVFDMLRDELVRQIEARNAQTRERRFLGASGNPTVFAPFAPWKGRSLEIDIDTVSFDRLASSAPMGDSGRVTDLAYDPDSDMLTWSYVNLGDYDLSGEVGISDITPIAQNFLAKTTDGFGDDALEAWIDGNRDREVGIPDITIIAQDYLNTVAGYRLLTCASPDGEYVPVGELVDFGDSGVFPKEFSAERPDTALLYVAIEPVDGSGNAGERSDAVKAGNPPSITGLSSTGGVTGTQSQFSVTVSGNPPFTYNWNFGGGATPNQSTSASPTVTLGSAGAYSASVTVTNRFGNNVRGFTLTIINEANPPVISDVTPNEGWAGNDVQFGALVSGAQPLDYSWDFGGGAEPNISTDATPSVQLSAAETYSASLTVTNEYGSDTYNWNLVVHGWHIETVDSECNVAGSTSIALDSNGHPHISCGEYFDAEHSHLKYAFHDGSEWNIVTVDGYGRTGYSATVALDSNERPHIGYGRNEIGIHYAYFNGLSWNVAPIDVVANSKWISIYTLSMALDSSDHAHFSYYVGSPYNDLKYLHYDGFSWEVETPASEGWIGNYSSIALDSKEYPHISYLDFSNTTVNHAYWNGSSWVIEVADSEGIVGWNTCIALDSNDYPHITYEDRGNGRLKYAYWDGSHWNATTVDSEESAGDSSSVAIDSRNQPHIAYYCAIKGEPLDELRYANWNGTSWIIVTIDNSSSDVGDCVSIALDYDDNPHISYFDRTNKDLRYAYLE